MGGGPPPAAPAAVLFSKDIHEMNLADTFIFACTGCTLPPVMVCTSNCPAVALYPNMFTYANN